MQIQNMTIILRNRILRFIAVILFISISIPASAQWTLDVVGSVKKEETGKRFDGVTITIKKNGAVWKTLTSEAAGKFQASLEPDGIYLIEFSRPGHVTKKIEFSTKNVPPDDAKYGFEFPMEMNLFEKIEGLDVSVLNKPIAKVAFNPATGYMDYDPEYTKSVKDELERLKKELEERLKKQAEERKLKQGSYDKAILAADKAFNAQQWQAAKPLYEEAAKIFPDESYPQFQLGIISDKLAAFEEANKRYTNAIAEADKLYSEKSWDNAILAYQKASSYKLDEKYPADKVKEIKDIIANDKKNSEAYNAALAAGNQFMTLKEYAKAKTEFKKASTLKSHEVYPKEKIAEIDKILAENTKKEEDYKAAIAEADILFNSKEYAKSKDSYNKALAVKPNEEYPKKKIAEADNLLNSQKKLEEDYKKAIAEGDQFFAAKDYQKAMTPYQLASTLKPTEQYPKGKLQEIKTLLEELAKKQAEEKQKELNYQAAITNGDKSMELKKYDVAKQAYESASSIKPEEKYPKDKIKEIETILADLAKKDAELKAKNEQYQKLITEADGFFSSKEYQKSKDKFLAASTLKSEEKYPQDKIKEIDLILANLAQKEAEQKALDEQYKKAIVDADGLFNQKDYSNSKLKYQTASTLKSEEKYPKDKIVEIDKILSDLAKKEAEEKAKNKQYDDLIVSADMSFKSKNYEVSKTAYTDALKLKPTEKYPQDKIKEIDTILAEIAKKKAEEEAAALAEKQKNEKYQALIAAADKDFTAKSYDTALKNYNDALSIKPNETYPKNKITEINNLLSEIAKKKAEEEKAMLALKDKEEKYKALITSADKNFTSKSYEDAKQNYTQALTVKPEEQYPKNKIEEIDQILADIKAKKAAEEAANAELVALNEKYNNLIKAADNDFKTANYKEAKIKYYDASALKKDEQYPKDKINEITKLLADLAQQSEEKRLAEETARKKKEYYDAVIAQAEGELTAKNYDESKKKFQEASVILPDEQYPKTKIKEIDDILAKINADKENKLLAEKDRNEKYNALIAAADGEFSAKNYEQAKSKYKEALSVKPNESYPQAKITEIDIILADIAKQQEEIAVTNNALKQKQEQYNQLVKKADEQFNKKAYKEALPLYNEANNLMPTELYPKQKISEINSILTQLEANEKDKENQLLAEKQKRENYNKLIYDADRAFKFDKYVDAKYNYENALALYPDEKYPKEQLEEVNKKMNKSNEVVTVSPIESSGNRVRITDAKNQELEAMIKELLKNREAEKGIAVDNYRKEVENSEKILVTSSSEKTKNADQKNKEIEEEIKQQQIEGNKYHTQHYDKLKAEKLVYEEAEKTLLTTSESKRQTSKDDAKKQEEEILVFTKSKDKDLEAKMHNLYSFADGVNENELILQEKSLERRTNNQTGLVDLQEKINDDNNKAEKRRKDKELKVEEYTKELHNQEIALSSKANDRKKYNQDSLVDMVNAIHKQQLKSSKYFELNAAKIQEYIEHIDNLEKRRTESAIVKMDNNKREIENYETEMKEASKLQEQNYVSKTAYLKGYKSELAQQEKARIDQHNDIRKTAEEELKEIEKYRTETEKSKGQYHLRFHDKLVKEQQKNEQFYADMNTISYQKIRSVKPHEVYVGALRPSENFELASKYPQGISEETLEEGNAVVLKRIKVTGNHVDIYEKRFYKWGGKFYTKNGYNITETLWDLESIEK